MGTRRREFSEEGMAPDGSSTDDRPQGQYAGRCAILSRRFVAIASLSFVAACAQSRQTRPAPNRDQYLIVRAELAEVSQSNLEDAIRQLRPTWFTRPATSSRGSAVPNILVYLDDRVLGAVSTLRSVPVGLPDRVRYLSPSEAQFRFGNRNGMAAAIVIEVGR